MDIFFLILAGALGGILGGMGMGGGTLLIPILTIFLKLPQGAAQWLNLLSFIPMSIIAVTIHAKNKLISKKVLPIMIIPAAIAAAGAAYLATITDVEILRFIYGIFLTAAGSILLTLRVVKMIKSAYEKRQNQNN